MNEHATSTTPVHFYNELAIYVLMKKAPLLLAAYHPRKEVLDEFEFNNKLKAGEKKIAEIFGRLAAEKKKRTLFVEMEAHGISRRDPESAFFDPVEGIFSDPFTLAVQEAKKHGWRIEPLEQKETSEAERIARLRIGYKPEGKALLEWRYAHFNCREKAWAGLIAKKATEDDIVLIHPNHVKGFLTHSNLPREKVVWVHRPLPNRHGPLTENEIEKLFNHNNRAQPRKTRRNKP